MDETLWVVKKGVLKAFLEEILNTHLSKEPNEWILESEAMELLGIKSKSHLWKLRSEGRITYTQPSRKILLYSRSSIHEYLNSHIQKAF